MNFHQILRRFDCLEVKAGYMNHKYNPLHKRVTGLKQHIYQDELLLSNKLDLDVYARAAFLSNDEEAEAEFNLKKQIQTKEVLKRSSLANSRSYTGTASSNNFSRERLKSGRIKDFAAVPDPLLSLSTTESRQSQKPQSAKDPRRHIIAKCTIPTQGQIEAAQRRQQKLRQEKIAMVKTQDGRVDEDLSSEFLKSLYRIKIPESILAAIRARQPIEEIITTKKDKFSQRFSPNKVGYDTGKSTVGPQTCKNADITQNFTFPSPKETREKNKEFITTVEKETILIHSQEGNRQEQNVMVTDKSYYNLEDSPKSKIITRDKNNLRLSSNFEKATSTFSDQIQSEKIHQSAGTNEPHIDNFKPANCDLLSTKSMIFNLKITDLTRNDNPFVVFDNREIDIDGYLVIEEKASSCLPWLDCSNQIQKRTLKIEVKFGGMLVLLRFIHLDKLYDQQYQKIALQVAHNMIQDNTVDARVIKEDGYCRVECPQTEISRLIESLNTFQLHIGQLKGVLEHMGLKLFPQFMKGTKVIIEFSDCILQAADLCSYTIIIDETGQRVKQKPNKEPSPMALLQGQKMQKNIRVDEYGIIYEPAQKKQSIQEKHVQEYVRAVSTNAKARTQVLRGTSSKIQLIIRNQLKEPSAADMQDQLQVFQHLYPHGVKTMSLQPQQPVVTHDKESKMFSGNGSEEELTMVFKRNTSQKIIIKTKAQQKKDYTFSTIIKNKGEVISQGNQVHLPEILEQKSVSETQNLSRNQSLVRQTSEMRSPMKETLCGHSKETNDVEYRMSSLQLKYSDYQPQDLLQQKPQEETFFLSPQKSFIFKGSQARKLVRDLLHTRDRSDPLVQLKQMGIIF